MRRWIPPALLDVARTVKRTLRREKPDWEFAPNGWNTADAQIKGWNLPSFAQIEADRWPAFLKTVSTTGLVSENLSQHNILIAYAYALALTAQGRDRISILDWGGGLGHYGVWAGSLLPGVQIDYSCRDFPANCEQGRRLFSQARFFDNDDECWNRQYDLVLSSSAIQYLEDWKPTVTKLAAAASRYLYIASIPTVAASKAFVIIQRPYRHGYTSEYLGWAFNQKELIGFVESNGMPLVREFFIDTEPQVVGAPEQVKYRSFLFRKP